MSVLVARVSGFFRARRMRRLIERFPMSAQTRVLDVGGTAAFWRDFPSRPFLVLLNVEPIEGELRACAHAVWGDGRQLPFPDRSFDLVISNSAIEHVGARASQRDFAREIARVGKSYWVQTPNRWFPLEQHLFFPLPHWFPRKWQAPIVRHFSVWSLLGASRSYRDHYAEHYLRDIHLLSAPELRALFPKARILRETILGWPKSWIAVSE